MARSDADDRRYHAAMARQMEARGFLNLAQAHALAAKDCPAGCSCTGCETTRAEVSEALARRTTKRRAAA